MSKVRARGDNGMLFFDFRFKGQRCREQTTLADTAVNRKRLQKVLEQIEAEIVLGSFKYRNYFPNSKHAAKFDDNANLLSAANTNGIPLFRDFVEVWTAENEVRWRFNTKVATAGVIRRNLLPEFGDKTVSDISRADVLGFRAKLAKLPGKCGNETVTAKSINNIMGILQMILREAASRYEFVDPTAGIKRLKQRRPNIQPFTMDEVNRFLNAIRADYRDYFTVRFFTGMRSGEVHGLKWKNVDFAAKEILVRETFARGRVDYTKTDGSQREVQMSSVVYDALKRQQKITGAHEYVFCSARGTPRDTNNVANRVWYPCLRYLGLAKRRPYECRHTAATMWLAAGENPEWIARQLGHTTTEMLFRVYSRFVPNATRNDGSAFDRFVSAALKSSSDESDPGCASKNDE